MKSRYIICCLLMITLEVSSVTAYAADVISGVSDLSDTDIRNSAIAFVNTTASPGLKGATLTVDNEERYSEQFRSSLGFNAELTIRKHIFNGYWGLAIVTGVLKDEIDIFDDSGQPVSLDLKRDITGLRGSAGLSFPVNQNFKLRPFLSIGISHLTTRTSFDGLLDENFIEFPACDTSDRITYCKTSAELISTAGTFEAIYSQWYGENRLEFEAQYNLIYTDSISGDNPILNTTNWDQTVHLKSRYSGPTSLNTKGRPWRWHVYLDHANFISLDKTSLGYTGLFEVGTGLEWELNIKPLDWFGWQSLGISVGVITSNNVEGYNIGLTAR